SIVIGFWVGLAVFVIFMFFVLTLLTKTGAPHQENLEPSEKRFRMNSFSADFGRPLEADKVFSRHVTEESKSLFHCYINEVEQLERARLNHKTTGFGNYEVKIQEVDRNDKPDDEMNCLTRFNIPNFVNSEQNSSLADDDLLICEPPIILESKPIMQNPHQTPQ
uniref:Melanocortin 2 receptor accessory protein 2 n=2 Tax=Latimeria chalumnae TaxID=7897 RepID=H3B097_LATCH